MGRRLRWLVPVAVVALGLALTAGGFAYDLAFAGLPYQDPTPEQAAGWRYHAGVAEAVELAGAGVTGVGLAGLVATALWPLTLRHAEPGAAADAAPKAGPRC